MSASKKYALLIGVEEYLDKDHLTRVAYAEADVASIRHALLELGYGDDEIIVLLGERATKTSIEHEIRMLVEETLNSEDSLLVFFAGHGLGVGRTTYLLCRDTRRRDIEATGIDLSDLVRELRRSPCVRLQLYLDCCHGEFVNDPTERGLVSQMAEEDLERALRGAEHFACFSACRFNQKSHSSGRLEHGIWTYHLVQALTGQVPAILAHDKFLTASSLQDYLSEQVPLTVRDTFTTRKNQTPWYSGSQARDFLVADLSPITARKAAAAAAKSNGVKDFVFRRENRVAVSRLSGFKPGVHKSPKWGGEGTEVWVAKIAHDDIEADIARVHERIRTNLGYTRRQIVILPTEGGYGSIWTPDFQYTISVGLDDDFTQALFTRELTDIRTLDVILDEGFIETFNGSFEAIRVSVRNRVKIEDLIDKLEAKGLRPDYPPDASSFTLIAADDGVVSVTEEHLTLAYPYAKPLKQLAVGFVEAIRMLPNFDSLKVLPQPSQFQLE